MMSHVVVIKKSFGDDVSRSRHKEVICDLINAEAIYSFVYLTHLGEQYTYGLNNFVMIVAESDECDQHSSGGDVLREL
jgi:hypothetical protein